MREDHKMLPVGKRGRLGVGLDRYMLHRQDEQFRAYGDHQFYVPLLSELLEVLRISHRCYGRS